VLRLFFWLLAVAAIAWAAADPRLRDPEGIPTGAVCLPISLAAAFAVAGAAWRSAWRRAALWLALALAGQAVALQMIDAGTRLHYQHYRPLGWLAANRPWLLLFAGFQTAAVAAGWRGRWRPAWRWLRRQLRWWQLALVAAVFGLTAATVSEDVRFYVAELAFAAFLQTVNLGNVILVAWSLPAAGLAALGERLRRWFGQPAPAHRTLDRVALAAAVWVTAAAALLSWFSYERHPHIPDEVVCLLHARYLAAGKLWLAPPPVPAAFEIDQMYLEPGRWFCPVPPGWPATLALGVLAGAPWLVNPILAGLNTLLAFLLLQRLYDRYTARLGLLLLATSPWHVLMAMNFMTHTASFTFALLAANATAIARERPWAWWAALAGLAVGGATMVRPLEGFTFGCIIALALFAAASSARRKITLLAAYAAGSLILTIPHLYYNRLLTGDPLKFPIMAYFDKYYGLGSNALGFGPNRGMGWAIDPNPGHSPFDALVNANLNAFSINIELFGWGTGSLILAAFFLVAGSLRGIDRWMLGLCAAVFTAHFFYYFSGGPDFGARYWYLMLIPCIVFTIAGLQLLGTRLESSFPDSSYRLLAAVIALCTLSAVNYMPWRAVDKYHHYEQMRPDVRSLARELRFGRSLVLVQGNRHPDYASAAIYNPLDLSADVPIYAWDRSPEVRRQVLEQYRDRPVWVLEGPTRTGAGFRVKAGPLAAAELLHSHTTGADGR
jgi:hypothetical protein